MQRQFRSDDTSTWTYQYGDGSEGATYSVPTNEGCSGTSGAKAVTLAAAGSFVDGMLVLIHQTRGTGVGTWELNKISSGGTTTSLTMELDLTNTYTDSGSSQAQMIELKQYEDMTTGAITGPSWNGSKGGIIAYLDKGTTTIDATVKVNGSAGSGSGAGSSGGGATGGGFYGGNGASGNDGTWARQGEGTVAASGGSSRSANGNGGGGSQILSNTAGAGGGAGHSSAGENGSGGSNWGFGGDQVGTASLITMDFGGGGGGGVKNSDTEAGGGGSGGGIVIVIAKNITVTGAIQVNGGAGANREGADGGGGAGGSILFKGETLVLGSSCTSSGAAGGSSNGGDGRAGRIHADYATSISGTTSPTIDTTQDSSLLETTAGAGNQFYFM